MSRGARAALGTLALAALLAAGCGPFGGDDGTATTAAADVPRPVVDGAGPTPEVDDADDDAFVRATFSPDGDGVNDALEVRVRARPGTRLELRLDDLAAQTTVTPPAVVAGEDGTAVLVWDGKGQGRRRPAESAYVGSVCVAGSEVCASRRVLAHRRLLSAWVEGLGSVAPGEEASVQVRTDREGPVRLELVPAHHVARRKGLGVVDVRPADGPIAYRVPDVPRGGQWVLRVSSGNVRRYLPLVVRGPGLDLERPPAGTALVVYPALTWRAYSRADSDRDGRADSWYQHPEDPYVLRDGPYETGRSLPLLAGSEPAADLGRPLSRFLAEEGLAVQAITDVELARMSPEALARYPTLVFAGHQEYYEDALYAKVMAYLEGGGRAIYLMGNPFYGEVEVGDDRITRLSYRYRTPDRSDFAIAANGFRTCCWPADVKVPYTVAADAVRRLPWLFAGTGVAAGDAFGRALGEVDGTDPELSPPGTLSVASGIVPKHEEADADDEGGDAGPAAWIGTQRIPYEPAGLTDQRVDIAYAELAGGGELFSWGNHGFLKGLYRKADPAAEREAQLVALRNLWRRFTR